MVFLSFHLLTTESTSCQLLAPPWVCETALHSSHGYWALTRFAVRERGLGSPWASQSNEKTSFGRRYPTLPGAHPGLNIEQSPPPTPPQKDWPDWPLEGLWLQRQGTTSPSKHLTLIELTSGTDIGNALPSSRFLGRRHY